MTDLMCAETILSQTGWKRPYPQMICQDKDILMKITEYDFDLNDEAFREYLEKRGICSFKNFTPGIMLLEQIIDFLMNWDEDRVMNDPSLAYSQSGLQFDKAHREVSLRIWKIMKGKMQDCWEIYKENEVF
jgi:hypothetical protein